MGRCILTPNGGTQCSVRAMQTSCVATWHVPFGKQLRLSWKGVRVLEPRCSHIANSNFCECCKVRQYKHLSIVFFYKKIQYLLYKFRNYVTNKVYSYKVLYMPSHGIDICVLKWCSAFIFSSPQYNWNIFQLQNLLLTLQNNSSKLFTHYFVIIFWFWTDWNKHCCILYIRITSYKFNSL